MIKASATRAFLGLFLAHALGCAETATTEDTDPVLPANTVDGSYSADTGLQSALDAAAFPGGYDAGYLPYDGGVSLPEASLPGDSAVRADGSVTGDASTPAPGPALKPKCVITDRQLIVIGDSYINWTSHSFPTHIKEVSGQSWRMEAVGGFSLGSGGIGSIPGEFDSSIAGDPNAHTILMDGGGNDILIPDITRAAPIECTTKGASKKKNCQDIVSTAMTAASNLMKRAADKGIRDVVYFFYPHVPANTILSGDSPR